MYRIVLLSLFTCFCSTQVSFANWPQFRGPAGKGTLESKALPDTWSRADQVAWHTPLPGRGWSSPIVWGDKVFLTAVESPSAQNAPKTGIYIGGERRSPPDGEHRWLVLCLELATGKVLWQQQAHKGTPPQPIHVKNSYASETPVTDGEFVYAQFGNVGMFCYDFSGKLVWSRSWTAYPTRLGWGPAASPVLHKDRLFLVNDNEEKSHLLALDKKTGRDLWRVDRDEKSNWATPFVWEHAQRTELVTSGTSKVRSYSLEGKLLWESKGMSLVTVPTPFEAHGLLYLSAGLYMSGGFPVGARPLFAVKPGAAGDISLPITESSSEYIAWRDPLGGPYNTTPLVYGEYLYVLHDVGVLSCYEAKTGKQIYTKQKLESGPFTASPWAYQGKIFCLAEDGTTTVLSAGPEFKVLHTNKLEAMTLACPAFTADRLLVRTLTGLYCLQRGQGK